MNNQKLNEAVAEKLGLKLIREDGKLITCHGRVFIDTGGEHKPFGPATHTADAVRALEMFLPDDTWLRIQWWSRRQGNKVVHTLDINGVVTEGSFCEVICSMILRTK